MALMLSLMVVYLSVGTTVMHCLRYDKVMVGPVKGCCSKKRCMEVKQVKLSPTLSIQKADFDAAPVFAGILPSSWMTLPCPVAYNIQKVRYWNLNVPHSPPRAYLTMLNTLII